MASHLFAPIFALPSELILAVIASLGAKDVIAFRQTCKSFNAIEKTYHHDIWRKLNTDLCSTTPLFSPSFDAHPAILDQESVSQRAMRMESILLKANRTPTPLASRRIDIQGGKIGAGTLHTAILVPGGRYLLLVYEKNLEVWELSPFMNASGAPTLVRSFTIPWCSQTYASTLGGAQHRTVRLLLRSLHDTHMPEEVRQRYGVSPGELLDIYRSYELVFTESTPKLRSLYELPLVRQWGTRLTIAFSKDSVSLMMEELYSMVWNFVENKYAYWRHYSPGGPMPHYPYLTDTHINAVIAHKNLYGTITLPALKPVDFPSRGGVFRLPIYTPATGAASLFPGETNVQLVHSILPTEGPERHLRLDLADLYHLHPRTAWGVRPSTTSTAVVRDYHKERIDTSWYELNPFGFLDLPECSLIGRATHRLPSGLHSEDGGGDGEEGENVGGPPTMERQRIAYSGQLVTASMWRAERPKGIVYASISPGCSGHSGGHPLSGEMKESQGQLFPLAEVDTPVLGLDFCPLSGILVAVSNSRSRALEGGAWEEGSNYSIRVWDFARP